jgi:hypothetical protein
MLSLLFSIRVGRIFMRQRENDLESRNSVASRWYHKVRVRTWMLVIGTPQGDNHQRLQGRSTWGMANGEWPTAVWLNDVSLLPP